MTTKSEKLWAQAVESTEENLDVANASLLKIQDLALATCSDYKPGSRCEMADADLTSMNIQVTTSLFLIAGKHLH